MNFTAYSVVYVLNNYYDGNKSHMARDMLMTVDRYFNIYHRVVIEGHDSPTMMEAVAILCGKKEIDMREIWKCYHEAPYLEPIDVAPCPYFYVNKDRLDKKMENAYDGLFATENNLRIATGTQSLIVTYRDTCCGFGVGQGAASTCKKYKDWRKSGIVDLNNMSGCACHQIISVLFDLDDAIS